MSAIQYAEAACAGTYVRIAFWRKRGIIKVTGRYDHRRQKPVLTDKKQRPGACGGQDRTEQSKIE